MDANAIRNARLSLGLTQAQFAERLGISDRYMRNLEKGDRQPGNALARVIQLEASAQGDGLQTYFLTAHEDDSNTSIAKEARFSGAKASDDAEYMADKWRAMGYVVNLYKEE